MLAWASEVSLSSPAVCARAVWRIGGRRIRDDLGLLVWVDARAWTTGDGPKAIFNDAVGRLFERGVLLPGVRTLARLVGRVRDEATQRLWDTLAGLLSPGQCRQLERLLTVPGSARARCAFARHASTTSA
jgi:hypothetical protein